MAPKKVPILEADPRDWGGVFEAVGCSMGARGSSMMGGERPRFTAEPWPSEWRAGDPRAGPPGVSSRSSSSLWGGHCVPFASPTLFWLRHDRQLFPRVARGEIDVPPGEWDPGERAGADSVRLCLGEALPLLGVL